MVTHDVITNLSIGKHAEVISIGVVSISHPLILGLDWLQCHNSDINWENIDLSLSCCNLTHCTHIPAKGFSLAHPQGPTYLNSVATISLGFSLNSISFAPCSSTSTPFSNIHSSNDLSSTPPLLTFVSLFLPWTGFGHSETKSTPSCKPDIVIVNPCQFLKYSKSSPVALIHFHPIEFPSYNLASMSKSTLGSELGPDIEPSSVNSSYDDSYTSHILRKVLFVIPHPLQLHPFYLFKRRLGTYVSVLTIKG